MTVKAKTKKKIGLDYKALYEAEKRESEYNKSRWSEAATKLDETRKILEVVERQKNDAEHQARHNSEALQKMKYDVIRWLINPETVPKDDDGISGFGEMIIHRPRIGR